MKKHHFTLKETQNCKLFLYTYDLCSIGQGRHCAEPATLHQIPVTEKNVRWFCRAFLCYLLYRMIFTQ